MLVPVAEPNWTKLEDIVRRIVREEIRASKKPAKAAKPQIRLNGKGWEGISDGHREAWKTAYPLVDIGEHLSLAAAWCYSNVAKAPRSDFGRFLDTWLRKQQNEAAAKAIPTGVSGKVRRCARCKSTTFSSLTRTSEGEICNVCRDS